MYTLSLLLATFQIKQCRGRLCFQKGEDDEDMTTLDTTKNIAYMHICEVISNANYSIIYLCYPEQKYFTHFCVLSNCRCMGHLYNPHMKIREKEKFRLCSKSPSHVTFGPREDRVQVSHVLDSDSDCTDIPDSTRQ